MHRIQKRVVLHFPGFEPLNAVAHRARYDRSARQSASAWDYTIETGMLQEAEAGPYFDVGARADGWTSQTRMHVFDHNDLVLKLTRGSFIGRLASGYLAALRVIASGGAIGYFRHAWRFGLFFIFPFLLMALGMAASVGIAIAPFVFGLSPWSLVLSVALAALFFRNVFLPQAERLHTLHLFADWELAVAMAGLDRQGAGEWIERCAERARLVFAEPADEYVVSSHSMGSSIAAHVIGYLLEREPRLFEGKTIVFATLGSAVLQCALMRPATALRSRVGLIAHCPAISWLDVHCLTDAIHFYKVKVVEACGHGAAPQARIMFVRFKTMLTKQHYDKIRRDFLRVHRQYVLGPDRRASFDFTLMTAGPLPAAEFGKFTQAKLPSLRDDTAANGM